MMSEQGKQDSERIGTLDALRGAAVLLVVLTHATGWGNYGPINPLLTSFNWALTALRMPILFVISGVLAQRYVTHASSRFGPRTFHFVWLYLIWVPIGLLGHSLMQPYYKFDISRMTSELIAPTTEMWFIWALALMTATLRLVRRYDRRVIVGATAVVSTMDYAGLFGELNFAQDDVLRYAVMFFLGAFYASELKAMMIEAFSTKKLLYGIALLIPMHVIGEALRESYGWQVFGTLERLIVCLLALYAGKLIDRIPYLSKPLTWFGRKTLPIYVAHVPIIMLIAYASPQIPGVPAIIMPFAIAALAIAISLVIDHTARSGGLRWVYAPPQKLLAYLFGAPKDAPVSGSERSPRRGHNPRHPFASLRFLRVTDNASLKTKRDLYERTKAGSFVDRG